MLRSFKIGEYIFSRIKTITGYECYPCVADNDVKFPYIVYNRTGLSTDLTKDGYTEDNVSFEISIYSDKYAQSIQVAEKVREALEILSAQHDELFEINNSIITNSSEFWNDNTFVQQINWSTDITRFIDMSLYSSVNSINFQHKPRFSYLSHTVPEDYEVELGSTINIGNKYVIYTETTIDPYIIPITITQNDKDVTNECTFSFPTDTNINMEYDEGKLIFTAKNIEGTYFTTNVVVSKDEYSISIPFTVNFTISVYNELPNYATSDIFDVTQTQPLTLYGKAAGKDDILADSITTSLIIEQDAPWPISFGTLTVKEPKPEPTYDTYLINDGTFTRKGSLLTTNINSELQGSLNVDSYFSGGAFVVTNQLATDDTFTSFTKGLQSNAYYSVSGLHSSMHHTITNPMSTFIDNYDFSNVDHVDLALEICMGGRSLSGLRINGVNLLPYIVDQYGTDWASTVTWKSQTITLYNYRTDTSYNSHNVSLDCCYLELTGLPVEIITNYIVSDKYTGIYHSNGNNSALLYNFKLIKKQE